LALVEFQKEKELKAARQELMFRCKFEALITTREGMVAENKQREHAGQFMAYVAEDFNQIQHQFCLLEEELRIK
jgi:hypothetical protein